MENNVRTVLTADGTVTLFLPNAEETYHSIHGALTESLHVFIQAGLSMFQAKEHVRILEIGFGTGLNALLSAIFSRDKGLKIEYYSVEKFPVSEELWKQLNYGERLHEIELFKKLHSSPWNEAVQVLPNFSLNKIHGGMEDLELEKSSFDLIYYDAFAPRVQPELWTIDRFAQMYELLNKRGILVTYCAKGEVKRNMKAAGFQIEALPGPPGKREMTRAQKI